MDFLLTSHSQYSITYLVSYHSVAGFSGKSVVVIISLTSVGSLNDHESRNFAN